MIYFILNTATITTYLILTFEYLYQILDLLKYTYLHQILALLKYTNILKNYNNKKFNFFLKKLSTNYNYHIPWLL